MSELNEIKTILLEILEVMRRYTGVTPAPPAPAPTPTYPADIWARILNTLESIKTLLEKGYVIARPMGGIRVSDSITTTSSYQTVVEYKITPDAVFHLTKILVSCDQDVLFKIVWNDKDISPEIYVKAGVPFTDWYPWLWPDENRPLKGGTIKIQAKYPSGGSAGTCYAEIVGEEE
mgnify:CR=1 FL=1